MELKQLQYFVVSVDMGSFQNAAKMLYTTQPHVSKTVKALEEELHLKLLQLSYRKLLSQVFLYNLELLYFYILMVLRKL